MPKRVRDTFAFSNKDGSIAVVSVDDIYDDDHPYVKAYPDRFEDNSVNVIHAPKKAAKVEQASAAPGETRDVKPRKFGTVTDQ